MVPGESDIDLAKQHFRGLTVIPSRCHVIVKCGKIELQICIFVWEQAKKRPWMEIGFLNYNYLNN